MKSDIENRIVSGVQVAVVPGRAEDPLWDVYLLNTNSHAIQSVLVSVRGYGTRNEQAVETSALRHFYDEVAGNAPLKVEPLQCELFDLNHEYWVSYEHDGYRFDKKFVFVPGSLTEDNFSTVPILNCKGILHA